MPPTPPQQPYSQSSSLDNPVFSTTCVLIISLSVFLLATVVESCTSIGSRDKKLNSILLLLCSMRQKYLLYPPPWEEASSYLFQRVTSREETKILFYKQIQNTFPRTITVILEQTRNKENTKKSVFGQPPHVRACVGFLLCSGWLQMRRGKLDLVHEMLSHWLPSSKTPM